MAAQYADGLLALALWYPNVWSVICRRRMLVNQRRIVADHVGMLAGEGRATRPTQAGVSTPNPLNDRE